MDIDIEKAYLSQIYSFQEAVNAFGRVVHDIHLKFEAKEITDWPTVLLSTLLQTTAMSLYQLLPKKNIEEWKGIVDRRSIATLVRNLVDTHDTIDSLCNVSQPENDFILHRDIMAYYLSVKFHKTDIPIFGQMDKVCEWYWTRICEALPDEGRRKKLKSAETLFYKTRKERLKKSCGEHADFVGTILADLSTYVHSVPPSLWMKTLEEAFTYDKQAQGIFTVWLQVTNFYYARSINIVLSALGFSAETSLQEYIGKYHKCFEH